MTGFGRATGKFREKQINVEIRSLNSKQLDLNLKFPSLYKEKEAELRSMLMTEGVRGKIDVSVTQERAGETPSGLINTKLAAAYLNDLKNMAVVLKLPDTDYFPLILRMPDVIQSSKEEMEEGEWDEIYKIIRSALEQFKKFRREEGRSLGIELSTRINGILIRLEEIKNLDLERVPGVRDRLMSKIESLGLKESFDHNRFEQEIVFYLEKLDITEEKKRLEIHCNYFLQVMDQEENQGRKLGFITQEIGREINTIGSKANEGHIQKLVVEMKDELEKIKEQTLNVL